MMINRVRTLILNRSREGYRPDTPGEEFIPASYSPKQLPVPVVDMYRLLFGEQPDRLFLNIRMRQIMQLLHSSPLSQHVGETNTLTYLPVAKSPLPEFVTEVVNTSRVVAVTLLGKASANMSLGQCEFQWDITYADNVATVTQIYIERQTRQVDVIFSSSLSSLIPLHGSKLQVRFTADAPLAFSVKSTAKPDSDFAAKMQLLLENHLPSVESLLFGGELREQNLQYLTTMRNTDDSCLKYACFFLSLANFIERQEAVR